MENIANLTQTGIANIRLIVLDVDGVLVPRGTRIRQEGNITTLETKKIRPEQISQIRELHEQGFLIDISSGRGLYMLQEMFEEVLPFVSLTYENGSATWYRGEIHQHINSFERLRHVLPQLRSVRHEHIKGFEPKEFIITIHCHERVLEIERILAEDPSLYCLWNGEAYDIGIEGIQTKALGLKNVLSLHGISQENALAIGDNINDRELVREAGIGVSADPSRLDAHYCTGLETHRLPADILMEHILECLRLPVAEEFQRRAESLKAA